MTSDAKIGLLLGLVFIFVIAFIINGLPNFGSHPQSADASQAATFDSDDIGGLADGAEATPELLSLDDILSQDEAEGTDDVMLPDLEIAELPGEGIEGFESVRSNYPLGDLIEQASQTYGEFVEGLEQITGAMRAQTTTTGSMPPFDIPPARPTGDSGLAAVDEPSVPEPAERPEPRPAQTGGRTTPTPRNPQVGQLLSRTYEVKEGETLATVAKNVYGPVEGNRLVNIKRIYSANALLLNSPDEIFVGQTLVIPPLPEPQAGAEAPNPTLSEGLFERVQSVGRENVAEMLEPQREGRWYTVEEGDSLWKIASKQLGSGARCDEIAKMNVDILKNKEVLRIGMRLRLPLN